MLNLNKKLAPSSQSTTPDVNNFLPFNCGNYDNTTDSILAPLISEACHNNYFHISSNRTTINLSQSRTELDSHADTCTVGRNALITHVHNRRVNVHSYDASLGCQRDMQIVNAALAYDCPLTGEIFISNIN